MAYPFQPMDKGMLNMLSQVIQNPQYEGKIFTGELSHQEISIQDQNPPQTNLPYSSMETQEARN